MNIVLLTISYVVGDPFFWMCMAFTTIIGIFIGAIIYDGNVEEVKRGIILLASYFCLITITNLTRIIPDISRVAVGSQQKPLGSIVASAFVTIFYLLGMAIGVQILKKVHKK
jgi:hypothetical protein